MPPFMERESSKQRSLRHTSSGRQLSALGKGEVIVPIDEEEENEADCSHKEIREKQTSSEFFFSVRASEMKNIESSTPNGSIAASSSTSILNPSSRRNKKKSKAKSLSIDVKSDPPTKLIENFLQRQAASGNLCLDMDMDMMDKLPQTLAEDGALITNTPVNPSFSSNLMDQSISAISSASFIVESSSTIAIPDMQFGGTLARDVVSFSPTHAPLKALQEDDKLPTLFTDAGTSHSSASGNAESQETLADDNHACESNSSSDEATHNRLIVKDDLLRFMREAEVEKAMALFEGAMETGKITKNALKDFAVHVVRERRALSLSLNDTKTAVTKLHRLVDVVVGVGIAIICMLVLGIATTHLLLLVSSQLVVVVFIFGNTCKNVFEAIVFLFVMHPFDVGDRCVVDGNQVVVEEMNILSTVFMRNDGEKLWYPNSLLATKFLFNYSRTPDTGDTFDFSIDSSTPPHKICALQDRITKYLGSKASLWSKDSCLIVKEIENDSKMKMQLMVNHTINYDNPTERQIRRSDLILEVKKMLQELDIAYHLPVQPLLLNNFPYHDMRRAADN